MNKFVTSRAFRPRKQHRWKWRRRWKILLLDLLGREEPPERVAAAIGLGVAIGFSPFIGFHLFIALGLALLFRLNKIDTVLGTFCGNAPTWTPIFPIGYRLGRLLLGFDSHTVPRLNWGAIFHSDATWIFHPIETAHHVFGRHAFAPRFVSFLLGTTILAVLLGFIAYGLTLSLLRLYHRRHPRVAIRAAHRRERALRSKSSRA